tara:strand:- start:3771 stop:4592 length:822 start_codon:yes stop_codon:yes gene_type:complete
MSSSDSTEGTVIASAFINIKWFFIITLIYFTVKHIGGIFTFSSELILFSCYYILILITQSILNIENSKIICGSSQGIIYSTFISWILVFGGFLFMLLIFPGWNIPFSHSIGYSVSQFAGSDLLLRKVLNQKIIPFDDDGNASHNNINDTQKRLLDLYTNDPSYLINEIPLELNSNGEWIFWKSDTLISDSYKDKINIKNKLYNLLFIKESTGHFIWYMLVGILCCLVNFNYILTTDCVKSMEQIDDDYANQTESINNTETPTTNYNTNNAVEI